MGQTATNTNGTRVVRGLAIGLIVIGLVVGLGAGWQWYGKVRRVAAEQERLERSLSAQWSAGSAGNPAGAGTWSADGGSRGSGGPAGRAGSGGSGGSGGGAARAGSGGSGGGAATAGGVAAGSPIGRLHLPTIGQTLVVVEGAGRAQLDTGPGRMTGTTALGKPGNTALAGHRYPGVFWNLDRIEVGDPIVIETVDAWLVYRAVRTVIVQPLDEAVLAAPGATRPTMLTLITCEPKLSTSQRLIKQAELIRTDPKSQVPGELKVPSRR